MKTVMALAFVAGLIMTSVALADGTLVLVSERGDFVGQGSNTTISFTDANVAISNDDTSIYFANNFTPPYWSLELKSAPVRGFPAGCYERAQNSQISAEGRPGLDFSYDVGCNQVIGRFKVIEIETDAQSGRLTKFAADFVEHCEALGPAIFGKLRYNSAVPADYSPLAPVFSTVGFLSFASDQGDPLGTGRTAGYTYDRSSFLVRAGPTPTNAQRMIYQNPANFAENWELDIVAAGYTPLAPGFYAGAERYPFQTSGHPGLAFALNSFQCNTLTGDFDISNVTFDPIDGDLTRLSSAFTQHCEGVTPALRGTIDFTTQFRNGPASDVIFLDNIETTRVWPLYSPDCL